MNKVCIHHTLLGLYHESDISTSDTYRTYVPTPILQNLLGLYHERDISTSDTYRTYVLMRILQNLLLFGFRLRKDIRFHKQKSNVVNKLKITA